MSPGRLRTRTKKEQKRRRQLDLERRAGLLGVRCRICGEGRSPRSEGIRGRCTASAAPDTDAGSLTPK
jgi:hypothetical protein